MKDFRNESILEKTNLLTNDTLVRGGLVSTPLTTLQEEINGVNNSKMLDCDKVFDYFTFHIFYERGSNSDISGLENNALGMVRKICGILKLPYRFDVEGGCKGFRDGVVISESLHIFFNATFCNSEDKDCMRVDIKGSELSLARKRSVDMDELFNLIDDYSGYVKRVDLAIDLYEEYITIDEIKNKLSESMMSTTAKSWEVIPKRSTGSNEILGETVYIGDRHKSKRYMRIYDKNIERAVKKQSSEHLYWLRFELVLTNEYADEFIHKYNSMDNDKKSSFISSQFLSFCDFKENVSENDIKHNHKCKNPTWSKYLVLLDNVEKSKLVVNDKKEKSSMCKKIDWLNRSVAKTLAMAYINECLVGNGFISFVDLIKDLIVSGLNVLRNSDLNILENELLRLNIDSNIDMNKLIEIKSKLNDDFNRLVNGESVSWLDELVNGKVYQDENR